MSDQDFFFDEDEQPAAKAADKGKAAPPKAPAKGAPAKGAKSAPAQASGGIELTWTITALIGVVALLLGVIIGYAIPNSSSVETTGSTTTQQQVAPQLTPEEMQSGTLPQGHPDISGMASGSAETSPAQ